MVHLILLAAAIGGVWLLVVWARPFGRCGRCKGKRVIYRKGKRPKTCPRCKGRGKAPKRGAATVNRFIDSIAGDRQRARFDPARKGKRDEL